MDAEPSLLGWLPRLLTYPLRGHALLLILTFAPLMWLAANGGPLGWWALLMFGAWTVSYVFTCTERTALGEAEPPALEFRHLNPFDARLGAFVVYCAVLLTAQTVSAHHAGRLAAALASGALAVLLPAHLVLAGAMRQAGASLDPEALLPTVRDLGMNGVLAAIMTSAVAIAVSAVAGHVPLLLLLAGLVYSIALAGHAAGFAAFHARHALGLTLAGEDERDQRAPGRTLDMLMDEVLRLDRERRRDRALALLQDPPTTDGWDDLLALQKAAFGRLAENERNRLAREHGRGLVAALLGRDRIDQALDVLSMARVLGPDRLVEESAQRHDLARAALERGQRDLALAILGELRGDEPGSAAAALLRAWLLAERGEEREARNIVARLGRQADPRLDESIRRLRQLLVRLGGTGPQGTHQAPEEGQRGAGRRGPC